MLQVGITLLIILESIGQYSHVDETTASRIQWIIKSRTET